MKRSARPGINLLARIARKCLWCKKIFDTDQDYRMCPDCRDSETLRWAPNSVVAEFEQP